MKARLGIAIAVNLDPKILIVDEVLAVGDLKFRQKCMAKMAQLCQQGMTLLFVSHNPSRIRMLCDRAIILRNGRLVADGQTEPILEKYISEDLGDDINIAELEDDIADNTVDLISNDLRATVCWDDKTAPGDETVKIISLKALDLEGKVCDRFTDCESFQIEITYVVKKDGDILRASDSNERLTGKDWIFTSIEYHNHWSNIKRSPGTYRSVAIIPAKFLDQGYIRFGASVYSHQPLTKHAMTRYATVNIEIVPEWPNSLGPIRLPKQVNWPHSA